VVVKVWRDWDCHWDQPPTPTIVTKVSSIRRTLNQSQTHTSEKIFGVAKQLSVAKAEAASGSRNADAARIQG
jgi:hypothetical protein